MSPRTLRSIGVRGSVTTLGLYRLDGFQGPLHEDGSLKLYFSLIQRTRKSGFIDGVKFTSGRSQEEIKQMCSSFYRVKVIARLLVVMNPFHYISQ